MLIEHDRLTLLLHPESNNRRSRRAADRAASRGRGSCGSLPVEKPVHVHDLHATILHLMGIDHTKLTYRYSGRNFRLTDVHGRVIHEIIA